MESTNQFTTACKLCMEQVSANSRAQFNRTFGMHMRNRHGITGVKTDWWGQITQEKHPDISGKRFVDLTKEEKREYYRQYKRKNPQNKQSTQVKEKHASSHKEEMVGAVSNAVAVSLSKCPCCNARFYAVIEH